MNETIEILHHTLRPALLGLGKVISKRSPLPVLGHVRVTRDRAGQVCHVEAVLVHDADDERLLFPQHIFFPGRNSLPFWLRSSTAVFCSALPSRYAPTLALP